MAARCRWQFKSANLEVYLSSCVSVTLCGTVNQDADHGTVQLQGCLSIHFRCCPALNCPCGVAAVCYLTLLRAGTCRDFPWLLDGVSARIGQLAACFIKAF